jgi:hypothetical protein
MKDYHILARILSGNSSMLKISRWETYAIGGVLSRLPIGVFGDILRSRFDRTGLNAPPGVTD